MDFTWRLIPFSRITGGREEKVIVEVKVAAVVIDLKKLGEKKMLKT